MPEVEKQDSSADGDGDARVEKRSLQEKRDTMAIANAHSIFESEAAPDQE